jgi:hypothetical protein
MGCANYIDVRTLISRILNQFSFRRFRYKITPVYHNGVNYILYTSISGFLDKISEYIRYMDESVPILYDFEFTTASLLCRNVQYL